jgi:uncharacterized membrane protein
MAILILGLALFLGIHSISIVAPKLRESAVNAMGAMPWRGAYSLISAVGFGLILYGFHLARLSPVVLWVPPAWTHYLTVILMLPVFPLVFAAYMPGRIKTAMKHPMLAAVKFWALAHLLSDGMLAGVVLFGAFLVWAVADRISFKRRPPQMIKTAPPSPFNDVIAVVGGVAVYALVIFWAHVRLFGVSPLS